MINLQDLKRELYDKTPQAPKVIALSILKVAEELNRLNNNLAKYNNLKATDKNEVDAKIQGLTILLTAIKNGNRNIKEYIKWK